jgi:Biopolymer transport proteins
METEILGAAQALDFSIAAMFTRASPVVQAVTVLLALASLWSWAVIVDKLLAFRRGRRDGNLFEDAIWSGQPLDELQYRVGTSPTGAMERVLPSSSSGAANSSNDSGPIPLGACGRISARGPPSSASVRRESGSASGGIRR